MMPTAVRSSVLFCYIVAASLLLAAASWAGGGPQNVLVVVNDASADSQELGHYYAARRGIPQQNICHVTTDPEEENIDLTSCEREIIQPLYAHIDRHELSDQIRYVVLCKDFPSRVNQNESITSVLFYGFKDAPSINPPGLPCSMPASTRNPYYAAERSFEPLGLRGQGPRFLPMLLTGETLEQAKAVVDRGVAADGTLPGGTVYLFQTQDANRSVRDVQFDNYIFSKRFFERAPSHEVHHRAGIRDRTDILGYATGIPSYPDWFWSTNVYLPGAIADHLTSHGGNLPVPPHGQSSALAWLRAGATASYGTVAEPCAMTPKFPDPMVFYWYGRGFTVAESYWMSVAHPYQGLFLGEPLAAPYAQPASVNITGIDTATEVSGVITVKVTATTGDAKRPCQRVDLFLNGRYIATPTNVGPRAWNAVELSVAETASSYIVNEGDSMYGVVQALAGEANSQSLPVKAIGYGDRLMLISAVVDPKAEPFSYSASVSKGIASTATLRATPLSTTFLESEARATKTVAFRGTPSAGDVFALDVTRSDGKPISLRFTALDGESLAGFADRCMRRLNEHHDLQSVHGLSVGNFKQSGAIVKFDLIARQAGSLGLMLEVAYQIKAAGATATLVTPAYGGKLEDNWNALTARGNVLFASGVDEIEASYVLDTSSYPAGQHELRAVVTDGTAVRVQGAKTVPMTIKRRGLQGDIVPSVSSCRLGEVVELAVTTEGERVAEVMLFAEGKHLQTLSAPPFICTMKTRDYGPGTVNVQAKLTGASGAEFVSAVRAIEIVR